MLQSVSCEVEFVCPHTDRPIDTGVIADPTTLARVWDTKMNVCCPHCGMEHNFKVREAYVEQVMRAIRLSA